MFWWWADSSANPASKQFGVLNLGKSHKCMRLDRRAAEEKAQQAEKARQAAEGMKLHIRSLSEENDQLKLKNSQCCDKSSSRIPKHLSVRAKIRLLKSKFRKF
jgi:hypothetical protein